MLKRETADFDRFRRDIKKGGRCVIMSAEKYAKAKNEQKYYSHRDFLADMILSESQSDKNKLYAFKKRVDL